MWMGGFLIGGGVVHASIFMVRHYDPTTRYNDLLGCAFHIMVQSYHYHGCLSLFDFPTIIPIIAYQL